MWKSNSSSSNDSKGRWRERGQVALVAAVFLPALLAMTGIAIDVGMLMKHRTDRQRTADAAAIAGAQRLVFHPAGESNMQSEAVAKLVACEFAQENGYGQGGCGYDALAANCPLDTCVNLPPLSGSHAGDPLFVEVVITRADKPFFMSVLGVGPKTVTARAVGGTTPLKRNYALIVLDPKLCNAFTTSSNITINGGGAIVNSNASTGGNCIGTAAVQSGGSIITAQVCKDKDENIIDCTLDYNPSATWSQSNNSSANPNPTKAPPFPDPLACPDGSQSHVEDDYCPRPVPCSNSNGTVPTDCVPWSSTSAGSGNKANNPTITQPNCPSGEVVLQPGVYFGGLKLTGTSCTYRFSPGIYVFAGSDHNGNGGGFDYQSGHICGIGSGCPTATGITFFNTTNPYANKANNRACNTLKITGSGNLKLAAPTVRHSTPLTGYKNMLIWQDDGCTAEFSFAGSSSGSTWTTTGIMYLPHAHMKVTGGGNFGSVQIITNTFSQSGSAPIEIEFTRYIDTDTRTYKLVE